MVTFVVILIQAGIIYAVYASNRRVNLEALDFWRSLTVAVVAHLAGWFLVPLAFPSLFEGGLLGPVVLTTLVAALVVCVAARIVMMTNWRVAGVIAIWYFVLAGLVQWFIESTM